MDLLEKVMIEIDSALPEGTLPPAIDQNKAYQEVSKEFSIQSVAAMGVVVLLAVTATYWAAGSMLRPLKRLMESVQTTDDQNLDRRVDLARA